MITEGHLLGGRVKYRQPASGFRSGIEPVLLAAAVPARAGDRVLEAGTGAGAALLCLCARVPGIHGTGIEIDPAMAALAAVNAQENGFDSLDIKAEQLETASFPALFDHALANPPYHPEDGSVSPLPQRERAKRGSSDLIAAWITRLSAALRRRGTLTIVVPTGMVPACLAAMTERRCACTAIFPLWPKANRPAKLVLLRGVKETRSPIRLMPGLVLHTPDGGFTAEAQAILTGAAALPLDGT